LEHIYNFGVGTNALQYQTVTLKKTKRLDILLNKTREEMAREYVTKQELKNDFDVLISRIDKLGEKLDKLFEVK
jgi:hypothetical protein